MRIIRRLQLPRPVRTAMDLHGLYGLLGLGIGMSTTIWLFAEAHPWLVFLGVLGFPIGVVTAAALAWLRGNALPAVSPSKRPPAPRVVRYGVGWEMVAGSLSMYCEQHPKVPVRFREEGSNRPLQVPRPYQIIGVRPGWAVGLSSQTWGLLWCAEGHHIEDFPAGASIERAQEEVRPLLVAAMN